MSERSYNSIDNENRQRRVLFAACFDASRSTRGEPNRQINERIPLLFGMLKEDSLLRISLDALLMTFGDTPEVVQDWTDVVSCSPPKIVADGGTPMGECVSLAISRLVGRECQYRQEGIPTFRSKLLFVIGDGAPTDPPDVWNEAVRTARSSGISIFAFSTDSSDKALSKFKELTDRVWLLKDGNFEPAFDFIHKSLQTLSTSNPNQPPRVEGPNPTQTTYVDALQLQ